MINNGVNFLLEKELIVSYKVAQLLVKHKKSHTEAESVIAPASAIIVKTTLGPDAAKTSYKSFLVKRYYLAHN